ncbi:MAG: hypothetical protein GY810_15035 [Aureispira sp.]|nr:hypothetical protein [Aureispira sp.]
MPCPPHPLELMEMNANQQRSTVSTKASAIQTTLAVFDMVKPYLDLAALKNQDHRLHILLQDKILDQKNLKAGYAQPKHLDLTNTKSIKDSQKMMMAIDQTIQTFSGKMKQLYDKYEVDLCVFRDLLMRILPYISEAPKNIQKILTKEKQMHLKHRKEDRAAKIRQLRRKMKEMKDYYSKKVPNPNPQIAKIKEQIAKIEAFTNEELLTNRNLF